MASPVRSSFDAPSFISQYGGAVTKFAADSIVYAQGDAADGVFYIQAGKVKLSVISEEGREAVISVLDAGDLFGKDFLAGQPQRVATAVTMTECILAKLVNESLNRARRENVQFCDFLVAYLSSENLRLTEQLLDHLFNSTEKRLARVLVLLADFGARPDDYGVIVSVDQQTLAKMVGTTRARVNFFMNKFRRLGFIDYNRDIHVHSSLVTLLMQ